MRVSSFKNESLDNTLPEQTFSHKKYIKLEDSKLLPVDLTCFSDEEKELAQLRYGLICFIEDRIQGGWTAKKLEPLIAEYYLEKDQAAPSWRTVTRWRQKLNDSGRCITSLVNANHKMGNHTKRIEGDEKYFKRALKQYLDTKRPSISTCYRSYSSWIIVHNSTLAEGEDHVQKASYETFKKRIQNLPGYDVAVKRYGKNLADSWYAIYDRMKPAKRSLERVEIDHTPLDVILLDDELKKPIGRPTLTLAVDAFSGCITGFHLSFNPASYVSVAKALVHSIQDKSYISKNYPSVEGEWPCHGIMETLVVDNGKEFWSKDFDYAVREAGIDIQYGKSGKGKDKSFVERIFKSINNMLLELFPGKTFSNVLEKLNYNPKKYAVMTVSGFLQALHVFIVDFYHANSNSRETRIPGLQWEVGVSKAAPVHLEEHAIQRFKSCFFKSAEKKTRKSVIEYEQLKYGSKALSKYLGSLPKDKSRKIKFKVDPDDLSSILVFLENERQYLEVPCAQAEDYPVNNMSLFYHKKVLAHKRALVRENKDEVSIAKAWLSLNQIVEQEQNELKRSRSKNLKGMKKQAQLAGVSSTGPGTVVLPKADVEVDKPTPKKTTKIIHDDEWDMDVEIY